jgi:predicted DNA-binding transcriptional regulator AlpA
MVPETICLTPRDAAKALSLGLRTLARLRERGEGPRFIRIGKAVRYPIEELREWRGNAVVNSGAPVN